MEESKWSTVWKVIKTLATHRVTYKAIALIAIYLGANHFGDLMNSLGDLFDSE